MGPLFPFLFFAGVIPEQNTYVGYNFDDLHCYCFLWRLLDYSMHENELNELLGWKDGEEIAKRSRRNYFVCFVYCQIQGVFTLCCFGNSAIMFIIM